MAVNIFTKNFMDNLEQLDIKTKSDTAITTFFLIERQNIWNYRKFWICKMWVVGIVLKLLLNLVAEQIISEKILIENSTTNNTKGKAKHPIYNNEQFSNEF
jgi:hypothetical protein